MAFSISDRGLRRIVLPVNSADVALYRLGLTSEDTPGEFAPLINLFQAYFKGLRVTFDIPLDYDTATSFQRRVWEATRRIPYGETRSYRWIAEQAGSPRGSRAAGHALGANPLPIVVPCHRVITADGKPGGFSGGLDMKRLLLSIEGIRLDKPES